MVAPPGQPGYVRVSGFASRSRSVKGLPPGLYNRPESLLGLQLLTKGQCKANTVSSLTAALRWARQPVTDMEWRAMAAMQPIWNWDNVESNWVLSIDV